MISEGRKITKWTRNGEFLVYLVPVGRISDELYLKYVQLLMENRLISISNLTRPGGYAPELSPFKSFSWDGSSTMKYHFVSTSSEKIRNFECEEVHACHRPIGIIGICHCPTTPNLKQAYESFVDSIRHFSGMIIQKCFAFEHQFDVGALEDCTTLSNLVMFPVHHELDEGVSTVSLHLQVIMDTMSVTILMSLEGAIRAAMRNHQQTHSLLISSSGIDHQFNDMASSLLDTNIEPTSTNQQNNSQGPMTLALMTPVNALGGLATAATAGITGGVESRYRRRQIARQRKLFGDYSVLLGCLPDAIDHYLTALELLREEEKKTSSVPGDTVWLAAALEGYIYCLYVDSKDVFLVEIVEKASEALKLYARAGCHDLELFMIQHVCWYLVNVSTTLTSTSTGREKMEENIWIKRLLLEAITRGFNVFPDVPLQRQIDFLLQASNMVECIGYQRHLSMILHEAASMHLTRALSITGSSDTSTELLEQKQKDLDMALSLEQSAARKLGMRDSIKEEEDDILADIQDQQLRRLARGGNRKNNNSSLQRRRALAPFTTGKGPLRASVWYIVRLHILRQLIGIAKAKEDAYLIGKFCIQLLELLVLCDELNTTDSSSSSSALHQVSAQIAVMNNSLLPSIDGIQQSLVSLSMENYSASASTGNTGGGDKFMGLYSKNSVYYTPPSSIEIKAKRYFNLTASPTMTSAAASLSSTIANTPRLLSTPRQQLSAAVNALSTKASPHFSPFGSSSYHGDRSPRGSFKETGGSSNSMPNTPTGSNTGANNSNPGGGGVTTDVLSSGMGDGGVGGIANSTNTNLQNTLVGNPLLVGNVNDPNLLNGTNSFQLDGSTVTSVWNLQSKNEILKMEKKILNILEMDCAPFFKVPQTINQQQEQEDLLYTFLKIDRFFCKKKKKCPSSHEQQPPLQLEDRFLQHDKALERYGYNLQDAIKKHEESNGKDDSSTTSRSDFFYSPFEKQKREQKKKLKEEKKRQKRRRQHQGEKKEKEEKEEEEDSSSSDEESEAEKNPHMKDYLKNACPANEIIEVVVYLSNPLGLMVQVDQANLRAILLDDDGNTLTDATECTDVSFTLEPYEKYKRLVLSIQPKRSGQLRILGVNLTFFRTLACCFIVTPTLQINMQILPILPWISFDPKILGISDLVTCSTTMIPQPSWRQFQLSLMENEYKYVLVRIKNQGQVQIKSFYVQIRLMTTRGMEKSFRILIHSFGFDQEQDGKQQQEQQDQQDKVEYHGLVIRFGYKQKYFKLPLDPTNEIVVPFTISWENLTQRPEEIDLEWKIVFSNQKLTDKLSSSSSSAPARSVTIESTPSDEEKEEAEKKKKKKMLSTNCFTRESTFLFRLCSISSLKILSANVVPIDKHQRKTIKPSCLLVLELENPSDLHFALTVLLQRVSIIKVEISRKCKRRLAIEITRFSLGTSKEKILKELVQMLQVRWETLDGAVGNLPLEKVLESMLAKKSELQQIFAPVIVSKLIVPSMKASLSQSSSSKNHLDLSVLENNFAFIYYSKYVSGSAEQVHKFFVDKLRFVPITFQLKSHQEQMIQVSSEIFICRQGSDSMDELENEEQQPYVLYSGLKSNNFVIQAGESIECKHHIQCMFLCDGIYEVLLRMRIEGTQEEMWHDEPIVFCVQTQPEANKLE